MMGQHTRSESLFYYFRLEDHVPENHLLRLIDQHISFAFVREKLKDSYSDTRRPSIDPELLLRILVIGYLYGITSERMLVEELRMHLAWLWFTGLGFDDEIANHSTFSKNRHGRFLDCLYRCGSAAIKRLFQYDSNRVADFGLEPPELEVRQSDTDARGRDGAAIPTSFDVMQWINLLLPSRRARLNRGSTRRNCRLRLDDLALLWVQYRIGNPMWRSRGQEVTWDLEMLRET
jgi:transposase